MTTSNHNNDETMQLIQFAALFNHIGAIYLEDGDVGQARVSFNHGLDCMLRAANKFYCAQLAEQIVDALKSILFPSLPPSQPPAPPPNGTPLEVMAVRKPPWDPSIPIPFQADEDSAEKNPQHFVYRHALIFTPTEGRHSVNSLFYSAVVIFNTAVCYHKDGTHPNFEDLRKAVFLYEICLELLREGTSKFDCSQVIICAMNNKACALLSLGDYIRATFVFDQLLSVVVSCNKGNPPALCVSDIEGIMHNILVLKTSCIAPAA